MTGDSVQHSGDNLTGEGEGDDEVIQVWLRSIPPEVFVMAFVVSCAMLLLPLQITRSAETMTLQTATPRTSPLPV